MMNFKNNLPDGKFGDKLCGVYRLDFSDGTFYIGSSTHLRRRYLSWRSAISKNEAGEIVKPNQLFVGMAAKIKHCKSVVFSVIEYTSKEDLRAKEEEVLCSNRGNDLMLNMVLHPSNKIIVKNLDGVEVRRYNSLTEAVRDLKIFTRRIQDVCDGYRKTCRGLIFEYENKAMRKPAKPKSNKVKQDRVLKFTVSGDFVRSYKTSAEAARDCKVDRKGIYSVMEGKQRTAAGFVFKRQGNVTD